MAWGDGLCQYASMLRRYATVVHERCIAPSVMERGFEQPPESLKSKKAFVCRGDHTICPFKEEEAEICQ